MPELPEVETTCRGISPHIVENTVSEVIVQRSDLRLPIPPSIYDITKKKIRSVQRRAKYMIIELENDHHLIVHLGMSGSLRIAHPHDSFRKHDHFALTLSSGQQLRYHDPRRFGIVTHAVTSDPLSHTLFENLGPEPLTDDFCGKGLFSALQNIKRPIKTALMDNAIVVGVGNIYASESLFHAGISPIIPASQLNRKRLGKLVAAVKKVLLHSIEQGGTTLRDFVRENGQPGYFRQELFVYERADQECRVCRTSIVKIVQAQRTSYYCPKCQK